MKGWMGGDMIINGGGCFYSDAIEFRLFFCLHFFISSN